MYDDEDEIEKLNLPEAIYQKLKQANIHHVNKLLGLKVTEFFQIVGYKKEYYGELYCKVYSGRRTPPAYPPHLFASSLVAAGKVPVAGLVKVFENLNDQTENKQLFALAIQGGYLSQLPLKVLMERVKIFGDFRESSITNELVRRGKPAVIELIHYLYSSSLHVKIFAIHTLGETGSPYAVPGLLYISQTEQNTAYQDLGHGGCVPIYLNVAKEAKKALHKITNGQIGSRGENEG